MSGGIEPGRNRFGVNVLPFSGLVRGVFDFGTAVVVEGVIEAFLRKQDSGCEHETEGRLEIGFFFKLQFRG